MALIAGVAQHQLLLVSERFGRNHGGRLAPRRVQHAVYGGMAGQVNQAHDLRGRQFNLPVPVLRQRRARGQPGALGGFKIVVLRGLVRRHGGHKKAGVKAFAHDGGLLGGDPARPGQDAAGLQLQAQALQHGLKAQPFAQQGAGLGGGGGFGLVGKQNAGFFKCLAHRRHKQAGCGEVRQGRLVQAGVQGLGRLVQPRLQVGVGIGGVHLAAGKDIGATQNIGQAVAFHQKNLQALAAVAQHHHRRGVAGWGVDDFCVEFHG